VHVFVSDPSSSSDTYDVLADPPSDCDDEAAQQIVFEGSRQPFLPIYFLQLDKMRQYVSVSYVDFIEVREFNISCYICSWSDCNNFTNSFISSKQ